MRDATFSLTITPSLPVPRPQLRVQIEEENTFDDFAVAIWKDVIYTCGSPMQKSKVIPSCISIALLCLKRHIAELLSRAGLIYIHAS